MSLLLKILRFPTLWVVSFFAWAEDRELPVLMPFFFKKKIIFFVLNVTIDIANRGIVNEWSFLPCGVASSSPILTLFPTRMGNESLLDQMQQYEIKKMWLQYSIDALSKLFLIAKKKTSLFAAPLTMDNQINRGGMGSSLGDGTLWQDLWRGRLRT